MAEMIPIAITILRCNDKYLFIKRAKPPYENLWSLIGGKIEIGEHIRAAAIREVMEETGTNAVRGYEYLGFITERLVNTEGDLLSHFLIFLSSATVESYRESDREGEMALFDASEVQALKSQFLPSDWEMFNSFLNNTMHGAMFEAELIRDGQSYRLRYYREV